LTGLDDDSQCDLDNYQSIVDKYVNKKQVDVPSNIGQERRRMPGTSGQASGSVGK